MSNLVLSLFPGIGLLDSAFEAEGFCVVRGPDVIWGGDIRKFHPPTGKFDGVIGGPPCQAFSSLANLVRANGHEPKFGNLTPEFERCVASAMPRWFLMENVPQAPEPRVGFYSVKSFLLDNSSLNDGTGFGLEQRRLRRFSFGMFQEPGSPVEVPSLLRWIDLAVFLLQDATGTLVSHPGLEKIGKFGTKKRQAIARQKAVSSSNGGNGRERVTPGAGNAGKGRYRFADACRLQGLPLDFLKDTPFTAEGKLKAVANGVPIPMGRAIAMAVLEALKI